MPAPPKTPVSRQRRRRGWLLCAGVLAFVWGVRAFVAVITPDNPNPFITPMAVVVSILAVGFLLVRTARYGRSRTADVALAGTVVLVVSGALLQFGSFLSADLSRFLWFVHGAVGLLVVIPIHLYLFVHLSEALRTRPVILARGGGAAMVAALVCIWTGMLFMVLQAREMLPLLAPHRWSAWVALALTLPHILRGRRAAATRPDHRPARRRFALGVALPLVLLAGGAALYESSTPDHAAHRDPAGPIDPAVAGLTELRTSHGELFDPHPDNRPMRGCSPPGSYCHIDNVAQWERSTHARSANVAYLAVVERFEADRPGQRAYCASCHEPARVYGHPDLDLSDPLDRGVGCVPCHRGSALDQPRGNGSMVVDPLPLEFIRTRDVGFLNFPRFIAELDQHRADFEPAGLDSELGCESCHLHRVPGAVHAAMPGYLVTDKVSAWRESRFAGAGPDADPEIQRCADCHMPPIYGPVDPTWTRSHAFFSGNTAIPWMLGLDERVRENQEFLLGRIALDVRCLPKSELPESAADGPRPGVAFQCEVVLENVGSGHDFPSGIRDLVDAWVDATLRTPDGSSCGLAGALDREGAVVDPVLTYRLHFQDEAGRPLIGHEFWAAASERGRPPIPPGGIDREAFAIVPGPCTVPGAELTVRLRHRRYNADFARTLLDLDPRDLPITDMAEARITLEEEPRDERP